MTDDFSSELQQDIQAIESVLKKRQEWLDRILRDSPQLLHDPRTLVERAHADGILVYQDQIDIEEIYRSFDSLRAGSQELNRAEAELRSAAEQVRSQVDDVEGWLEKLIEQHEPTRQLLKEIDAIFVKMGNVKTSPAQWGGLLAELDTKIDKLEGKNQYPTSESGSAPENDIDSSVVPTAYKAAIRVQRDLWQARKRQADALDALIKDYNRHLTTTSPQTWLTTLWLMHRATDPYVLNRYRKEFYECFNETVKKVKAIDRNFEAAVYQKETITGTPMPMPAPDGAGRQGLPPWVGAAVAAIALIAAVAGIVFFSGQVNNLNAVIGGTQTQVALLAQNTDEPLATDTPTTSATSTSTLPASETPTLTPPASETPTPTPPASATPAPTDTPDKAATQQAEATINQQATANAEILTKVAALQTVVQVIDSNALMTVTQQAAIIQQNEAVFVTQTAAAQATSTQLIKEAEAAANQQQAVSDAQTAAAANAQSAQTAAAQTATAEAQQTAAALTQTAAFAATNEANHNATATALVLLTQMAEQVSAQATASALAQAAAAATPEITAVPITIAEVTPEASEQLTEEATGEAEETATESPIAEATEAPEGISAKANGANIREKPDNNTTIVKQGYYGDMTLLCHIQGTKVKLSDQPESTVWYKARIDISVTAAQPSEITATPSLIEGYVFSGLVIADPAALATLAKCTAIPEVTPKATP